MGLLLKSGNIDKNVFAFVLVFNDESTSMIP